MLELSAQVQTTIDFLKKRVPSLCSQAEPPRFGVILGSGLGSLADDIQQPTVVPYRDIPNFPVSTAIGHAGRLVFGALCGARVVAMQGRFHGYEGYSARQLTFPVRVFSALGVQTLIVSNAAGGLNPKFKAGEIMVLCDHINLTNDNPLWGVNDDRLGPRFPDMSAPYDHSMQEAALRTARHRNFTAHRGVYAALRGPNYETRAEIRMLRLLGADAVGMSTVPEVLVARHAGLRVLGLSVISNVCSPDKRQEVAGDHVVEVAGLAAAKLKAIVLNAIERA